MIKYIKADVDYKLTDLTMINVSLRDEDSTPENILILLSPDKKSAVLMNHASALHPLQSRGALLPIEHGEINVTELKKQDPSIIPLHPEFWDQYILNKLINTEGEILSDGFSPFEAKTITLS